jgi:hypothetical protein
MARRGGFQSSGLHRPLTQARYHLQAPRDCGWKSSSSMHGRILPKPANRGLPRCARAASGALTVEAYERDTRQFLLLPDRASGRLAGLKDIADLRPADLRAFLAHRRSGGAGAHTGPRACRDPLLPSLPGTARAGQRRRRQRAARAEAAEIAAQAADGSRCPQRRLGRGSRSNEEPWIAARNAAVLTLALRLRAAHLGGARPVRR